MGYTHYYYVSKEFDAKAFAHVAADFKKMITPLRHLGVVLADGMGDNYPTISPTEITFNGMRKCGHQERELGITWPSESASGVLKNGTDTVLANITKSQWFAGAKLESRVCGGDCSHETFSLEQKMETVMTRYDGSTYELEPQKEDRPYTNSDGTRDKTDEDKIGKYFQCTKTAYKPYDLAVTICLVIAKHHLKDAITIHSDGTMENWHEAMQLCHHFLGYGKGFSLDDEESVPLDQSDAHYMISAYNKNTKSIADLRESHETLEKQNREKITEIRERYHKTISDLENQMHIETGKIQDDTDETDKKTDSEIGELQKIIQKTERITYYLKRKYHTPDTKCFESIKNHGHMEFLEKYSDGIMSLQLYVAENGRPTNKYSIVIVGDCILGGNDYKESILKLPYQYTGWRNGFDCSGNNIQVTPRHFKSIQDAKQYCAKNGICQILKEFFAEYEKAKSEYDEANSKYCLADFEEIIRTQVSKHWESISQSRQAEMVQNLGLSSSDVSEMSCDDVAKIAMLI